MKRAIPAHDLAQGNDGRARETRLQGGLTGLALRNTFIVPLRVKSCWVPVVESQVEVLEAAVDQCC